MFGLPILCPADPLASGSAAESESSIPGACLLRALTEHAHNTEYLLPQFSMAPISVADSDPFSDPIHYSEDHEYAEGSTLHVGRNASLTLATDSLIVLGTQA